MRLDIPDSWIVVLIIVIASFFLYSIGRYVGNDWSQKSKERNEARVMIEKAYESGDKDRIITTLNNYIMILGEQSK